MWKFCGKTQFPHSFRRTARISLNFQTRFCPIKIDHFLEIYHFIYIFFLLFEFQTQPVFLMFHLSTFFASILKYSPSSITITMLNDFILGTRILIFFYRGSLFVFVIPKCTKLQNNNEKAWLLVDHSMGTLLFKGTNPIK